MTHEFLAESIPVQGNDVGNKFASSLAISKFYVKSDIRFRFATTVMSSTMFNTNPDSSTEATFSAELPEKAYISYFTMTIGERVIVGEVKEKKQAKEKYDSATARGETAALVSEVPRETNRFDISVNVAASSSVLFNLTYVEVLERKLSCYRHILNIRPNQIVEDYLIHVSIRESRKIKEVKVPLISSDVSKEHLTLEKILQSQSNVNVTHDVSGKSCDITYMPTIEQQKEIHQDLGVNGQFSVFYDVSRQNDAGDILVSNGYFLHFFAPDPDDAGVTILPKHIVFILDTSGSMSGRKMMQLKDAMMRILAELNDKDCFNIIEFNSKTTKWKINLQNIRELEEGKTFVKSLKAEGGTHIGEALSQGISMLKQSQRKSSTPTIFFLTDGCGEDASIILKELNQQNKNISARIYSLAFGDDADIHFLKQLSSDHGGVCRKIYMDSDADLQVSGFYKEISSPLLSHLNITYMNRKEDQKEAQITQSLCQLKLDQTMTGGGIYYSGEEYVVCGRVEGGRVIGSVRGMTGGRGMINMTVEGRYLEDKGENTGLVIEKVWVCLTVKRILAEMDKTNNMAEKEKLRSEALQLSLKYGLVTALTSMVVTEENADEREIEKYKERTARMPSPLQPQTTVTPSRSRSGTRHRPISMSGGRRHQRASSGQRAQHEKSSPGMEKSCEGVAEDFISCSISNVVDQAGVASVKKKGSTLTTLYGGRKDSPGSDVWIRGDVKDSLVVEIFIEYSTYTINITPHGINVTNNHTGHRQSHTWGEKEVQAGGLKIMIHTDMLELEVEGGNKQKFTINREQNAEGMNFLYFRDVSKSNRRKD